MPLMTGQTTLSGATQVSNTSQTTGIAAADANNMLTSIFISTPAAAITWGKSNIATVPGGTIAANTNQPIHFGLPGIALKELYFKGTDAQVVNWSAATT